MTLPTIFATLPSGDVAASLLDTNFSVLEGGMIQSVTSTGVANTYILTPTDAWVTGYSQYKGRPLSVIFNVNNTGATSVNVSGLGAVTLYKNVAGTGTALVSGDLVAGVPYIIVCDGTNFWVSLTSSVSVATTSTTGTVTLADAATTKTATDTAKPAPVGTLVNHPGIAKAWFSITGSTGAILASYGVTSVSRTGTGRYTVTFSTAFADTNYVLVGSPKQNAALVTFYLPNGGTKSTTVCQIAVDVTAGGASDPSELYVAAFGNI